MVPASLARTRGRDDPERVAARLRWASFRTVNDEANRALIRRFFAEVWTKGRTELTRKMVADAYVNHQARNRGSGAGRHSASGFPDLETGIEELIAEADKVVVPTTDRGSFTGPFIGMGAYRESIHRHLDRYLPNLLRPAAGSLVGDRYSRLLSAIAGPIRWPTHPGDNRRARRPSRLSLVRSSHGILPETDTANTTHAARNLLGNERYLDRIRRFRD